MKDSLYHTHTYVEAITAFIHTSFELAFIYILTYTMYIYTHRHTLAYTIHTYVEAITAFIHTSFELAFKLRLHAMHDNYPFFVPLLK